MTLFFDSLKCRSLSGICFSIYDNSTAPAVILSERQRIEDLRISFSYAENGVPGSFGALQKTSFFFACSGWQPLRYTFVHHFY